jgi:hypothetical protein
MNKKLIDCLKNTLVELKSNSVPEHLELPYHLLCVDTELMLNDLQRITNDKHTTGFNAHS